MGLTQQTFSRPQGQSPSTSVKLGKTKCTNPKKGHQRKVLSKDDTEKHIETKNSSCPNWWPFHPKGHSTFLGPPAPEEVQCSQPRAPASTQHHQESRSTATGSLADSGFSANPHPFLTRSHFERHSLDVNFPPAPLRRLPSENKFRSTLFQTLIPKDKLEQTLHQLKPFRALWWSESRENIRTNVVDPNILNSLQSKPFFFTLGSTAQAKLAPLALIPVSQANPLKNKQTWEQWEEVEGKRRKKEEEIGTWKKGQED